MWTSPTTKLSAIGPQPKAQGTPQRCPPAVRRAGSLQHHRLNRVNLAAQTSILFEALLDLLNGGDHRRVVLAAECSSEVWVTVLRVVARDVHGDSARIREGLVATVALDVGWLEAVVVRDRLDDD